MRQNRQCLQNAWLYMGGSGLGRTDNFQKIADRTGSDSIFSDQEWTRTEKFHSPLISASNPSKKQKVSQVQFKTIRALRI